MEVINPHQIPAAKPAKSTLPPEMVAQIDEQSRAFEAMFMSQMMQFMWTGIESEGMFSGGNAEETWRGMLIQEYGTVSSKAGNLGIADAVKAELIKTQEKLMPATSQPPIENGDPL